jgi:hypothetical protein
MLQMNYLLPLAGRTSDSFVTNDLMRLPLGILRGLTPRLRRNDRTGRVPSNRGMG